MLHLNTIYIRKTEFHRLRELAPGDGKRGPPAQRLTTNAKYEVRPSWATPSSSPHTSLRYFTIRWTLLSDYFRATAPDKKNRGRVPKIAGDRLPPQAFPFQPVSRLLHPTVSCACQRISAAKPLPRYPQGRRPDTDQAAHPSFGFS